MKKTDIAKSFKSSKIENNFNLYRLIFDDKCVKRYIFTEYGDGSSPTFGDMLNLAKENGYKEGPLMLICESDTKGIIYMYGNGGNHWYEYGKTIGYA